MRTKESVCVRERERERERIWGYWVEYRNREGGVSRGVIGISWFRVKKRGESNTIIKGERKERK